MPERKVKIIANQKLDQATYCHECGRTITFVQFAAISLLTLVNGKLEKTTLPKTTVCPKCYSEINI